MPLNKKFIYLSAFFLMISFLCIYFINSRSTSFDGNHAYTMLSDIMGFGNRIPGSDSSIKAIYFMEDVLEGCDWDVKKQNFEYHDTILTNLIATKGNGKMNVALGTHFDTRRLADKETVQKNRKLPVPGANDGGSGTAILLELACTLEILDDQTIWLLFFDGEDQGNLGGWDWIVGSTFFTNDLNEEIDKVIIIDMVGDQNLNIYKEANSDGVLYGELWQIAKNLAMDSIFLDDVKYSMLDDHTPFVALGIPTILIIDFDYPYWHTTEDTINKVSPESLEAVGKVLEEWIEQLQ